MRGILCTAMIGLAVSGARAAKSPADYYRGRPGYFSYYEIEELKKDIPMAKRILAECLKSEQYLERFYCAVMAGKVGSGELVEELRPYLRDGHSDVRVEAVIALASIAQKKSPPLIEPLLDDPDPSVRWSVLTFYAYHGGRNVFQRIRQKLNDPDPKVKLYAAELLAREGEAIPAEFARIHVSSAPIARDKKNDELVAVQKQALLLLAHVGDERDFPMLDALIERRGGLNNLVRDQRGGEAMFAKAWIKLRLARTPEERAKEMDAMLHVSPITHRVYEALGVLHRNGDKQVRAAVERAAADKAYKRSGDAKAWLREQDGKGYGP